MPRGGFNRRRRAIVAVETPLSHVHESTAPVVAHGLRSATGQHDTFGFSVLDDEWDFAEGRAKPSVRWDP